MNKGFFISANKTARRLFANREGVSAIEFALIFPILIVLLAGTTDLGQALMVHRKMNQVVATAADNVAQKSSWTTSQIDAILTGTATILEPYALSDLTLLVTVVDIDSSNKATVNWSRGYNATTLSYGTASPVEIPSDIVEDGVQMVVATATFSLTTPFASFMKSITGSDSYEYSRFSIMRPRIKDTITLN